MTGKYIPILKSKSFQLPWSHLVHEALGDECRLVWEQSTPLITHEPENFGMECMVHYPVLGIFTWVGYCGTSFYSKRHLQPIQEYIQDFTDDGAVKWIRRNICHHMEYDAAFSFVSEVYTGVLHYHTIGAMKSVI